MQNIQRIASYCYLKHLASSTFCTKAPPVLNVDLAKKLFEFPDRKSAYNYASSPVAQPVWNKLDPDNATKSFELLRSFGRTVVEIAEQPNILLQKPQVLKNRQNVLAEIKFREVTVLHLIKFVKLVYSPIQELKLRGCIPHEVNVAAELCRHLHIDSVLDRKVESQPLATVRRHIIDAYLRQELGFSDADLQSMWKTYNIRFKHRSFRMLHRTVQLLRDRLNFEPKRIIRNAFVLQADADNIEAILERFPTLGGRKTEEVFRVHPRLFMMSSDHIAGVLDELRRVGISDEAVRKRIQILTYSIATVRARFAELEQVPEFQVLRTNPHILQLVTYQTKAKVRLNFLKKIKFNGASLSMLASNSNQFERYIREGIDRSRGSKDMSNFLETELGRPAGELRKLLTRHCNWYHYVLTDVASRLEMLRRLGFSSEDILECVWLLLYPKHKIEAKLRDVETIRDNVVDLTKLTPGQKLNLCLYLIEREHHFTGDGVWQPELQELQEFSTLDMPRHTGSRFRYNTSPTGG